MNSGMTSSLTGLAGKGLEAAMEPADEQRDDRPVRRADGAELIAAMEPADEQRDDATRAAMLMITDRAAMEPADEQRDDAGLESFYLISRDRPQWSPPMNSGMTQAIHAGRVAVVDAAMEPADEQRDDALRVQSRYTAKQ